MFDMLRKIWQVGTVTKKQPFEPAPKKYRGKIELSAQKDTNWEECIAACPTGALRMNVNKIRLFHGNCIQCGNCVKVCNTDALTQTTDCYLAVNAKKDLFISVDKDEAK